MKKNEPTREGDQFKVIIPNLGVDKENLNIIGAAFRGEVEKLKTLLENGQWPNSEIKQFIIPYLFMLEAEKKITIPTKAEVIKVLVQKGASISYTFSNLNFEIVKAIGDGGGDLAIPTSFGATRLHAVNVTGANSWKEEFTYLLQKGVDPNKSMDQGTVLHTFIAKETFDINEKHPVPTFLINCLGRYNYDWNTRNLAGETPLIMAAKVRASKLVKQLIAKIKQEGKKIDLNLQDKEGRTAFHISCALGDFESAKALSTAGASFEVHAKQGKLSFDYLTLDEASTRKILEEIQIDPNRDEWAIKNHIVDTNYNPLKILRDKSPSVMFAKKADWDIFSPNIIHIVKNAPYPSKEQQSHDLKFLNIQGANLSGKSLITACIEGRKDCLTLFSVNHIAKRPLKYGELLGKVAEMVKYDPSLQTTLKFINENNIPRALRQAVGEGKNQVAAMIIAYADTTNSIKEYIDQATVEGKTSLHLAAISANSTNDISLVELLISYEADITKQDRTEDKKLYSEYLNPGLLSKMPPTAIPNVSSPVSSSSKKEESSTASSTNTADSSHSETPPPTKDDNTSHEVDDEVYGQGCSVM